MTVFGIRWWIALLIIVVGIVVGNLVVPYVDDRPHIAR